MSKAESKAVRQGQKLNTEKGKLGESRERKAMDLKQIICYGCQVAGGPSNLEGFFVFDNKKEDDRMIREQRLDAEYGESVAEIDRGTISITAYESAKVSAEYLELEKEVTKFGHKLMSCIGPYRLLFLEYEIMICELNEIYMEHAYRIGLAHGTILDIETCATPNKMPNRI